MMSTDHQKLDWQLTRDEVCFCLKLSVMIASTVDGNTVIMTQGYEMYQLYLYICKYSIYTVKTRTYTVWKIFSFIDEQFQPLTTTCNHIYNKYTSSVKYICSTQWVSMQSFTSHSIHNKSFRDESFQPIIWLWYWQNKPLTTRINTRNPNIYTRNSENNLTKPN